MAIKDLNYRQQEVRKEIIRTRGRISGQKLADRFHVSRTTIWTDRQAIAKHAPVRGRRSGTSGSWDEAKEIDRALAEFEELRREIYEELRFAEEALNTFTAENRRGAESFRTVRVQLIAQARGLLKDKLDFLKDIGYFTLQARKFEVATKDVNELENHEVDAEIKELAEILQFPVETMVAGEDSAEDKPDAAAAGAE